MSWILWDPNPILFTIPWINKPVVWYGVFFALGFYLSYLLLVQLLERFFYQHPHFRVEDVQDWDLFREDICYKREGYVILSELSKATKNALLEEKAWTREMKEEVIEALNLSFRELGLHIRGVTQREKQLVKRYALSMRPMLYRLSMETQFRGIFFTCRARAKQLADSLFLYVFFGTLFGARLGHLLFYRNPADYLTHPYEIIAVWGGGLSSHGACIGIIVALMLFVQKTKHYSLLRLIDFITAPVAVCAVFIRCGNFFNQEILGIPTEVPWGIIFGHPLDGSVPVPRHPVQLYEAACYFGVIWLLFLAWRMKWTAKSGILTGLFFLSVFGARFIIEFFKDKLGVFDGTFPLMTGQILSIPIALCGLLLLFWKRKERKSFL